MTFSILPQGGGFGRYGVAAGLLLITAVLLGWSAGDTPPPPPPTLARTPWSLPRLRTEDTNKDLAIIRARHPWRSGLKKRAGPVKRSRPAAAPNWRLAGIVRRGGKSFALIASGNKLDYLRVGDRFPDGSVLVRITADSAVTRGAGGSDKPRIHRLFGKRS